MTRSGLVQLLVREALEARLEPGRKAAEPEPAPELVEARRQWRAEVRPHLVEQATRRAERQALFAAFEAACDRCRLTPPGWIKAAGELDQAHEPGLEPDLLLDWYRRGAVPDGEPGERLLALAEAWIAGQNGDSLVPACPLLGGAE